jgi:hypothetical protein
VKCLTFARGSAISGGRCVRPARFEERSSLPVSAACIVAAAMRETFAALFGAPVTLRLLEPVIPPPHAWPAIVREALLFGVRGTVADAAIVLRSRDAVALANAAFGELDGEVAARPLSSIESEVLARAVAAIARSLGPVCGVRDGATAEAIASIDGFTTFFEVRLERPVEASVGIALSRDPAIEPHGRLAAGDLSDLALRLQVTFDIGELPAAQVAALTSGAVLPLPGAAPFRGKLQLGRRTLGHGTCGVRDGRYALTIEELSEGMKP